MHELSAPLAAQRVLVVDDNPVTRYATGRVLKAAGFQICEAGTGGEALSLASSSLAAVILDVHLPDMDGFEVCRELRAREDTARLPVVHLSAARVKDDDKVRGLHSGADAYMTHPAEPALLVATVQALVRARTAEDAMRRSEARFRAIYQQAPSGICLIDAEGRFIDANAAMLALLGLDAPAIAGRRLAELAPSDWRARVEGYLRDSHDGVWKGEFPLLDAAGRPVDLEWRLSAHVEPGVNMAIATDISERTQLVRQREQLLEREQAARAAAERLSRSKDEFVAVLSHELRTPLNAIMGWVHVLKRSQAAADLSRGLDAIERNATTQTRLIADILDVSRMDLGKLRLDPTLVDPVELLGSSLSALAGALRDRELQLVLEAPPAGRPVPLDAARFQQIVWNLMTNAIKFSPPGAQVRVTLSQDEVGTTLVVTDQGQGIAADFLPFLFDRFTQSDSASNRYHGGLGLGLSIVQHLVELHGGRVTAESEGRGRGATFRVFIPAQLPPEAMHGAAGAPPAEEPADGGESLAGLAQMKILVVEDDLEASEMLSVILRDRGAVVQAARDCSEGLRLLQQFDADVMVSDIGLPGQDGYALIRAVRERERAQDGHKRLPAVALTAFARPQDRELALTAGFDAHCAKPLRAHELVNCILKVAGAA
ncbi:hybrid sensor histidine kinase/response regulator [Eleftheria terrae]|uniref:hybrid sensor histidine kinase/response regulator n=1 Tax=Eleftheria terrae TaxID=1597781 RepID=UPI00263B4620|nr:response regulator [Eleftheria terrae]WKB52643.1 response regulator [Eleftheria terrae]